MVVKLMKMASIWYIRCAVAAVGLIAGVWSVPAETLIFSDNFHVADGDLDSASMANRTSGMNASAIQWLSTPVPQTIVSNRLQLMCKGEEGTGASGGVRFVAAGDPATQWDWSSGAAGDAIIKAGGMSVSFQWTAPENMATRWMYLAMGCDPVSINYGTGWKLLAISSTTSSGILFENNGTLQAWSTGVMTASNNFDASSLDHFIKIDYQFDSWAAKSPVTANLFVDGKFMLTQTFVWKYGPGSQFMSIGTYQQSSLVGDFKVSTFNGTLSSGFSPATFVNKGELPWGAHQDAGTQWYCATNSRGQPCVSMNNNILTLTAYPIPTNNFHYQSGVVYAVIDVPDDGYNFVTCDVDMFTPKAGTAGCWPVFWLDSAKTWPPEVDVAEFKGNTGGGNVWQNVDGSDAKWVCAVNTISPSKWHHYGVALGPPVSGMRSYQLYIDGGIRGEGSFADQQGVPYCVVFNYSTEGDSGSPGPSEATSIQARNWKMAIH